jgi:hypothetical protein
MPTRSTSHRGLLAGLLALVTFACSAVALTARPTSAPTPGAPQSQAGLNPAVERLRDAGRFRDGDGRQDVVARGGRGR